MGKDRDSVLTSILRDGEHLQGSGPPLAGSGSLNRASDAHGRLSSVTPEPAMFHFWGWQGEDPGPIGLKWLCGPARLIRIVFN
jgi:hypothetical protein